MSVLPSTPGTLLSQLRHSSGTPGWQVSWKQFLELYHDPIRCIARACHRHHFGGAEPTETFLDDATANVVVDFFTKSRLRYDPAKGRLRDFLRQMINARVVDLLRRQRPRQFTDTAALETWTAPTDTAERAAWQQALLSTLIEELKQQIPLRQFEIFERVKLKNIPPERVAEQLAVKRGVVDNSVYKSMNKLREIAASPEYREEYFE